MKNSEPLFEQSQIVRHRLGKQEMIINYYEEVSSLVSANSSFINFGSQAARQPEPEKEYTGRVACTWVDKNNMPQGAFYYEHELEPLK